MTRVVHLSSVHKSGDIRIFEKECSSLARAGYDVFFVVPALHPTERTGVKVIPVAMPTSRLSRVSLTCFRIVIQTIALRPRICHLHDPELLPWGQLLRCTGTRVIYDMHENLPMAVAIKDWIPSGLRGPVARLCAIGERFLSLGMFTIFAETSYAMAHPKKRRSAIVKNLPLIETLQKVREPKYDTFAIAYVGAISKERGSVDMVRALGILVRRGYTKMRFECIGPCDDVHRAELEELARELGVDGNVFFRGYLPPSEAWKLVSRCHCGLAVLTQQPNYLDSYPTKMFEYMALGLSVIASDFPLYRSVIDVSQCGLLIKPQNPVALADAIERLVADEKLQEQFERNGEAAVASNYSWTSEERILLDVYSQLATASR